MENISLLFILLSAVTIVLSTTLTEEEEKRYFGGAEVMLSDHKQLACVRPDGDKCDCTGTIVKNIPDIMWVLTACHCLPSTTVRVHQGGNVATPELPVVREVPFQDCRTSLTRQNDLGLLCVNTTGATLDVSVETPVDIAAIPGTIDARGYGFIGPIEGSCNSTKPVVTNPHEILNAPTQEVGENNCTLAGYTAEYNFCFGNTGGGCPGDSGAGVYSGSNLIAVHIRGSGSAGFGNTRVIYFSAANGITTWIENTIAPSVHGDPHFVGFHGQKYDFHGEGNSVFNLITSERYQLNALFSKTYVERQEELTYITKLGMNFESKSKVLVSCAYRNNRIHREVVVNGRKVELPLNLENISLSRVGDNIEINTTVISIEVSFDLYYDTCFMNIRKIGYEGDSIKPGDFHGVLGQTLYYNGNSSSSDPQGRGIVEGDLYDYKEREFDIFGEDFSFNKFKSQ